jgi:hypothetical protein
MQATRRSHTDHENANFLNIWQGEARHEKYERLKLDSDRAYDSSSD